MRTGRTRSSSAVQRLVVVVAMLSSAAPCLPAADAANVLAFMPMPMKSHFAGFQPLFEELARRGHNVTVVSAFPSANSGYNNVDVSQPKFPEFNIMHLVDEDFITKVITRWSLAARLSNVMENKQLKEFIQSEANTFDLVMVETFYQEYTVSIGHKFNAPVVNLSPAMVWVSMSKWLHIPSTFSYIPDCCLGVTDDMNFLERLKNTITGVLEMYAENLFYIPKMKAIMNKYLVYNGWETRPPLEQMLKNVSLTLINANHAIGVCRPFSPGVIEIGGMHIKAPKPLTQDLQSYIDSATDGVIFFSFGSFVNLSHLPKEKLKVFLNVIGRLKQKVILKFVPDGGLKLPQNVMTGPWFPQNDILAHPNVKLFITHGGFHSVEEAVYNAIPIVGIPFFADQFTNMRFAEKKGYGKMVKFVELTEELFENAIQEVISNPTFKENAIAQSLMYNDQPMKPLDRAVYWIEYVIRNNGAEHLISDYSTELNDSQYFLFDIILTLLISTVLIIWLCYRVAFKVTSKLKTK